MCGRQPGFDYTCRQSDVIFRLGFTLTSCYVYYSIVLTAVVFFGS